MPALLLFFIVWQAGIAAAAPYSPCVLGDRLGRLSPLLPFPCEMKGLQLWLNSRISPGEAVILDNYNYEAADLARSSLTKARVFQVPFSATDATLLERELDAFLHSEHPRFLIYSPDGQLGRMWSLPDAVDVQIATPQLKLSLHRVWQDSEYRAYLIQY